MADIREELASVLQKRAGLDEPTSRRAVEAVMDFLKEKGPSVMTELGGDSGLGGMFKRSA